jgi:adenosylcobalamin-dependent ribonucleoside-triphosphate reductase
MIDVRYLNKYDDIILARLEDEDIIKSIHLLFMTSNVRSYVKYDGSVYILYVNRYDLNQIAKYCKNSKFYNNTFRRTAMLYYSSMKTYTSKVLKLEEIDLIDETYDISVEENHQFYADGILVSNSAEIAGGSINNMEFIELKDYDKNPERAAFGWTSNNTVIAHRGDNYKKIAEMVLKNGEPGIFWIDNVQEYSRMGDPIDNVDEKATFTNPCSEITLESGETCNLAEIFIARHTDYTDFRKTLKSAYIAAKSVTLLDVHWEKTNTIIKRNRRLGISVSGIAQYLAKHNIEELRQWLESGFKYLKELDKKFSEIFNIPMSIKLTCVKPSGTTSLLAGSTPGIHYPIARYYIRRVRISKHDPIMEHIKSINYPYEDCALGTDNYVVDVPVDIGEGVRSNPSMYEQLMITEFMQRHWADNQVSSTVTFDRETEGEHIESMLNYYQYTLKSISFLPKSKDVYLQMPYEEITAKQYKEIVGRLRKGSVENTPKTIDEEQDPMLYCDSEKCMM